MDTKNNFSGFERQTSIVSSELQLVPSYQGATLSSTTD